MTLGERIRKVRRSLDLTQKEFAERIGMKQNSVAIIESGKRNTSDQTILSICREFKVNEVWLRTGDGDPFQKLTRKESIASFMGEVLGSELDDVRLRVIDILSRLTADDWEFIEKRLLRLAAEVREEQKE